MGSDKRTQNREVKQEGMKSGLDTSSAVPAVVEKTEVMEVTEITEMPVTQ